MEDEKGGFGRLIERFRQIKKRAQLVVCDVGWLMRREVIILNRERSTKEQRDRAASISIIAKIFR